jgi:hypothetical protein
VHEIAVGFLLSHRFIRHHCCSKAIALDLAIWGVWRTVDYSLGLVLPYVRGFCQGVQVF